MRISDWSSDVCSSDLIPSDRIPAEQFFMDIARWRLYEYAIYMATGRSCMNKHRVLPLSSRISASFRLCRAEMKINGNTAALFLQNERACRIYRERVGSGLERPRREDPANMGSAYGREREGKVGEHSGGAASE